MRGLQWSAAPYHDNIRRLITQPSRYLLLMPGPLNLAAHRTSSACGAGTRRDLWVQMCPVALFVHLHEIIIPVLSSVALKSPHVLNYQSWGSLRFECLRRRLWEPEKYDCLCRLPVSDAGCANWLASCEGHQGSSLNRYPRSPCSTSRGWLAVIIRS